MKNDASQQLTRFDGVMAQALLVTTRIARYTQYICHCLISNSGSRNCANPRIVLATRDMPEHVAIHHPSIDIQPVTKAPNRRVFLGAMMYTKWYCPYREFLFVSLWVGADKREGRNSHPG
jgi:hypothetical protein